MKILNYGHFKSKRKQVRIQFASAYHDQELYWFYFSTYDWEAFSRREPRS